MGKAVIFCAGELAELIRPIGHGDYIIAADGGLRHTQALGLVPNAILGDFDSLGYIPQASQVFPVEKDDTDAMLAVRHALSMGCRELILYGGLDGERLDHTIANFQTLQFAADHGATAYLVGEKYLVTVLKNEKIAFAPTATGILSLFCLGTDAEGVTIQGLQYPMENGRFCSGFPLGVSNHFIGKPCEISVKNGSLLAMWDQENGFPMRQEVSDGN